MHCEGDKSVAKARLRLFRNKMKVREVNKKKRDGNVSDESDDSISEYEDSQETILEELFDIENDISTTEIDIDTANKKKSRASKGVEDVENI